MKLIIAPWRDGVVIGQLPENLSCTGIMPFTPLITFDSWETFRAVYDLMTNYYQDNKAQHETAIPKAIEDAFPDG